MTTGTSRLMIHRAQDAWAGLFFVLLGIGALVYSVVNYRLGSPVRMGPGFFPALVGGVVAAIGLGILVGAVRPGRVPAKAAGTRVGFRQEVATLASILLAVVAFGLLLKAFGLVVSVLVLVVVARATRRGSWLELLALAAILTAIAYAIFILGLGMPIRVGFW